MKKAVRSQATKSKRQTEADRKPESTRFTPKEIRENHEIAIRLSEGAITNHVDGVVVTPLTTRWEPGVFLYGDEEGTANDVFCTELGVEGDYFNASFDWSLRGDSLDVLAQQLAQRLADSAQTLREIADHLDSLIPWLDVMTRVGKRMKRDLDQASA